MVAAYGAGYRRVQQVTAKTPPGARTFADMTNVYDVSMPGLTGGTVDFGDYRGKSLLIVNVASKCGLTPQYAGLEKLYETYHDRGFAIVGVPSNQFHGQEPGSAEEIAEFCST